MPALGTWSLWSPGPGQSLVRSASGPRYLLQPPYNVVAEKDGCFVLLLMSWVRISGRAGQEGSTSLSDLGLTWHDPDDWRQLGWIIHLGPYAWFLVLVWTWLLASSPHCICWGRTLHPHAWYLP